MVHLLGAMPSYWPTRPSVIDAPEQARWRKVIVLCGSRFSMRRAACAGPASDVRWHCSFCHFGVKSVPSSTVSGLPSPDATESPTETIRSSLGAMVSVRSSTVTGPTLISTLAVKVPSLVTVVSILQLEALTVFDSGPVSVRTYPVMTDDRSVTAGDAQLSKV